MNGTMLTSAAVSPGIWKSIGAMVAMHPVSTGAVGSLRKANVMLSGQSAAMLVP